MNTIGSFTCMCNANYTGDPIRGCTDIDECVALENPCGLNAVCENTDSGYSCKCPQGFESRQGNGNGNGNGLSCEQIDVNIACNNNFDCTNNAECIKKQCFCVDGFEPIGPSCVDIDECRTHQDVCGDHAQCINIPGSYYCECETGFIGTPPRIACKEPCVDVHCGEHAFCKQDGNEAFCVCDKGWTFNPSNISAGCVDINECDNIHAPMDYCGLRATCTNIPGGFECSCPAGLTGDPYSSCEEEKACKWPNECEKSVQECTNCLTVVNCTSNAECPGNAICQDKHCFCPEPNMGSDCRHPCETLACGIHSKCLLNNGQPQCLCAEGYTGDASTVMGCYDIDECKLKPCAENAVCVNTPGSFVCQCPGGISGDPYQEGCVTAKASIICNDDDSCEDGETCVEDSYNGLSVCVCRQGFVRNSDTGNCEDINECDITRLPPACGLNAMCKNLPGSYDCRCMNGYVGNPFSLCQKCDTLDCQCQAPYKLVENSCVLSNCLNGEQCPAGAECISITNGVSYCACPKGYKTAANGECIDVNECSEGNSRVCAFGANCINNEGSYKCLCPEGYNGDPYSGTCLPIKRKCIADKDCAANEKCVQPGECICPLPYFQDTISRECRSPCERFSCGINAKCTPSDPPQCMCEVGFKGDPFMGCVDENECINLPCAYGALCVNRKGGYQCVCPIGFVGDPYSSGCILEGGAQRAICKAHDECAGNLACIDGACKSPCSSLLCGSNAYCEAENHAAWCRCRVGYVKDDNDECVSQCRNVICGAGAVCIPTAEGSTCKCPEGHFGNPFPGGLCSRDQCSSTKLCTAPKLCINNRCKERCGSIICGVGAKCDHYSGKCICEANFVGNPELICMPPMKSAACDPPCGQYAHCEYHATGSHCVCNQGLMGNPYQLCTSRAQSVCSESSCGQNSKCLPSEHGFNCLCQSGFTGNAFLGCYDIDECVNNPCGRNAACLNTEGGYECLCLNGYRGNPYSNCEPNQIVICDSYKNCQCHEQVICPEGYACEDGKCTDACSKITCGPNAICDAGKCICPMGNEGNAYDLAKGCSVTGVCNNDFDCHYSEICFQIKKGFRKCIDACSKIQCGPNAFCVAHNHLSSCMCLDGFFGSPNNVKVGCQSESRLVDGADKCKGDDDCDIGFVCSISSDLAHKECINRCLNIACGANEVCAVDEQGYALCQCKENYVWNSETSVCEKPPLPDCTSDLDCAPSAVCRSNVIGVLKCTSICNEFTCPVNAVCVAENHNGRCECMPGYQGNPNDRSGCQLVQTKYCRTSAECNETEECTNIDSHNNYACRAACDKLSCGPRAVCVTNNHVAQCQCLPGAYIGNPYDLIGGCKSVSCVYNKDCSPTQVCDRNTNTCMNVCEGNCGLNAVCLAMNHQAKCQCPPGFRANPLPEIECIALQTCAAQLCHETAICELSANGPLCKCPDGYIGDPKLGCTPAQKCLSGDLDCITNTLCDNVCGSNAECKILNQKAVCYCPAGFTPNGISAQSGCTRIISKCKSDIDCLDSACFNEECRVACRNSQDCAHNEQCLQNMCVVACSDHSQCTQNMACFNGYCALGCRSNKDCLSQESCINNKCSSPCENSNVCGPNALCKADEHRAVCICQEGFDGNPTPAQGCIRAATMCMDGDHCASGHKCIEHMCSFPCSKTAECAVGERCYNSFCRKVCYNNNNCLPGETCNSDGTCIPGCDEDADCLATQHCLRGRCSCATGYTSTANGCTDIDECADSPCHGTASCVNLPGSYECLCADGTQSEEAGCQKVNLCLSNSDCGVNMACQEGLCRDLCSSQKCGPNAFCQLNNNKANCVCPVGYLGNPTDTAIGCFKVECSSNEHCSSDKICDSSVNRCIDPCREHYCGYGDCTVVNQRIKCTCSEGYQLINNVCEDINECEANPCHSTAVCENTAGSFRCTCAEGMIGEPFKMGCLRSTECFTDLDCPAAAICLDSACKNPCERENACGHNAICVSRFHDVECICPPNSIGNPLVSCNMVECTAHNDCLLSQTCVDNKCVDPCQMENTCGQQAQCSVQNHIAVCNCYAGTTGNAQIGCVPLQYCQSEAQCASGSMCLNGICWSLCNSNRDCLSDQLCLQGVCQTSCKSNSTCPELQYCFNNICTKENFCQSDENCADHEHCISDTSGPAHCESVCEGREICGRNAECIAREHTADCECKEGYFGDSKSSCRKIECKTHDDCPFDKTCHNHMCKIACLIGDPCGENSLCSTENHKQVCHCQPGYTGDPKVGCVMVDICKDAPCGPGARCRNHRGSFKCHCPAGTIGDPYNEGCSASSECTNNNNCPPEAHCVDINGVLKCEDVCSDIKCGPNSKCLAKNHAAQCVCQIGYEGQEVGNHMACQLTKSVCHSSDECPANSFCFNNVCKGMYSLSKQQTIYTTF